MITFDVDTADVRAADRWLANATNQLPFVTSMALTNTVKAIHANLKQQLPSRVHQPTTWTRRGLIVKFARKNNLTAAVGFNYGDGLTEDLGFTPKRTGVPSGRYMDVLARGGRRSAKGTELALRRAGLIRSNQFITPSNLSGTIGKVNAAGNVPAAKYLQLQSRLRTLREEGSIANAPQGAGSRGRSGAKRADVDLFMRPGGRVIYQRVGARPKGGTGKGSGRPGRPQTIGYRRGIRPAFHVVEAPQYKPQFPVQRIAQQQFASTYANNFRDALSKALASRR